MNTSSMREVLYLARCYSVREKAFMMVRMQIKKDFYGFVDRDMRLKISSHRRYTSDIKTSDGYDIRNRVALSIHLGH